MLKDKEVLLFFIQVEAIGPNTCTERQKVFVPAHPVHVSQSSPELL